MNSQERRAFKREMQRLGLVPPLGGPPPQPPNSPTPPPNPPPSWYETVWGWAGFAVAILISVYVAMKQDSRGLLVVSWLFSILAVSVLSNKRVKERVRRSWVIGISAVVLGGAIWGYYVALEPTPFSIRIDTVANDRPGAVTHFYIKYMDTNQEAFLCPVSLMLQMRLTNLQNFGTTLQSFKVELEKTDKTWMPLTLMFTGGSQVIGVSELDFSKARRIEMADFETKVENVDLGPHQTIEGVAFFDYPVGRPSTFQGTGRFRVTITDSIGNKFVVKQAPAVGATSVNHTDMKTQEFIDLTGIKILRFDPRRVIAIDPKDSHNLSAH